MTPPGFDNAALRRMAAAKRDKTGIAFLWAWNYYHAHNAELPKVQVIMSGMRREVGVAISQGVANSAQRLCRLCAAAPDAE